MDAGGLRPLRPVRRVCLHVDSRRALLRRKTLAAANCLGADLVSHVRNIEIFALLMPLVVLSPLSSQFGLHGARSVKMTFPFASAATLVAILGLSTWAFAASHKFSPAVIQSPAAA